MPISLRFGTEHYTDSRNPEDTKAFYRRYITEKNVDAETQPLSVSQIKDLFLEQLVTKYDRILVITITSDRSQIFVNTKQAEQAILCEYKAKRKLAEKTNPFLLRIVDSQTMFSGQAVLVYEAMRQLQLGEMSFDKVRRHIEKLKHSVYAYLIPNDLFYLWNRARKKGDKSVGWLNYRLGNMMDVKPVLQLHQGITEPIERARGFDAAMDYIFDITRRRIEEGLLTPAITLSYAGDPEDIRQKDNYQIFKSFAQRQDIEVLISVMSTTAGINVGPGALSLAFIADNEKMN